MKQGSTWYGSPQGRTWEDIYQGEDDLLSPQGGTIEG